jgi:CubicO group peptidase (beta-lactamase class C family)
MNPQQPTIFMNEPAFMKSVDDLMNQGLAGEVFPGAVLLVSCKSEIRFFRAYGYADLFSKKEMMIDTFFDLASLTKPLGTTLAVLWLVQNSKLDFNLCVSEILPGFSTGDKKEITIRQLLAHCSGFADYRPYFIRLGKIAPAKRKEQLRTFLLNEKPAYPPGTDSLYSDLGFMVLEWVIEVISRKPLDRLLGDEIFPRIRGKGDEPCRFFFNKTGTYDPQACCAATELCPWRNKLLIGEVHDENAYAAGGVAGQAGLFGRAQDVNAAAELLVSDFYGISRQAVFEREILRECFKGGESGERGLGFDTPSPMNSSCGRYFSKSSVGHLGFTGTSFWIDLEKQVIVTLLTNRIHPWRGNIRIREFRPKIHDTVMETI